MKPKVAGSKRPKQKYPQGHSENPRIPKIRVWQQRKRKGFRSARALRRAK